MKTSFELTLRGKDWWQPFLGYWVLFVLLYTPTAVISQRSEVGSTGPILWSLISAVVMVVLQAVFTIVFLRIFMPKLSIGGKAFAFKGDVGKYVGMNFGGILLTIVTLSIYAPWYARRVTSYLASETTFDGAAPEFQGKGGKLFVYFLLAFWVPLAVVIVVFGIVLGLSIADYQIDEAVESTTMVLMALIFVVIIPFMYLVYKWYVNFRWNDLTIAWKTSFWPSCGFILGQLCLTVITAGIYWPAAALQLYRYFVSKTALSRGDAEVGRLGFEGGIGKGFGLLWGQTLLSIITVGIYLPWALANVARWLAASTYSEEAAQKV